MTESTPNTTPVNKSAIGDEYFHATTSAVWFDLSDLTAIQFTGSDRTQFLHNLTTNHIKRLTAGQGCETFLTDVQGHTIGHGTVFCQESSLLLLTVPNQQEALLRHFDKYLITEDVEVKDISAPHMVWACVSGPKAAEFLPQLLGDLANQPSASEPSASQPYANRHVTVSSHTVFVARDPMLGDSCFLIAAPSTSHEWLPDELHRSQIPKASLTTFHTLRIERGYPWFGTDMTSKSLPQEINRDAQAISFAKGCYLGQETVARIDALGHVNRKMIQAALVNSPSDDTISLETADQLIGTDVFADDKQKAVGTITSATYSPSQQRLLALATIRHEAIKSRKPLSTGTGRMLELM
ncbi:MAG: hypothetical protein R3E01_15805 [Pirellulaceae bacterium]|nr:folate-binding protein YgfZ [Planctomycetales bacterium]